MIYEDKYFSCHEKIAYKGFMGAIFFVAIIETIGVSFLLYNWNMFVHYFHLFINIIFMIFLFLDTKKVVNQPICLKEKEICLDFGMRPLVIVELENIQKIQNGSLRHEEKRKKKDTLDLSLFVMEEPTIEMILEKPITIKNLWKKEKTISSIFFFVDEKEELIKKINERKESLKNI